MALVLEVTTVRSFYTYNIYIYIIEKAGRKRWEGRLKQFSPLRISQINTRKHWFLSSGNLCSTKSDQKVLLKQLVIFFFDLIVNIVHDYLKKTVHNLFTITKNIQGGVL